MLYHEEDKGDKVFEDYIVAFHGENILDPKEDVLLAMHGGNGKGKVTGSSKEEDGSSFGKNNKERRWKSQPSPLTYTKVWDVGSSQKDKGTPSSTPK